MPKMKSHRGLAKRVKKTASGKLKRTYTSHWFSRKTTKQKRHLRKASLVSRGDYKRIRTLLVK